MKLGDFSRETPRTSDIQPEPLFEEQFRTCYRERFPTLFTYLDRLTGDAEAASDIAQDAFVRLHRRGNMPDHPAAWLIAVANNLVRDERRRSIRQLRILTGNPEQARLGARSGDPVQDVERAETVRAVRAALQSLTLRDRQALLLRHAGYSYNEIATALRLSKGGVGTTLVRAGQRFRAAYKEMHGAPE